MAAAVATDASSSSPYTTMKCSYSFEITSPSDEDSTGTSHPHYTTSRAVLNPLDVRSLHPRRTMVDRPSDSPRTFSR